MYILEQKPKNFAFKKAWERIGSHTAWEKWNESSSENIYKYSIWPHIMILFKNYYFKVNRLICICFYSTNEIHHVEYVETKFKIYSSDSEFPKNDFYFFVTNETLFEKKNWKFG